MTVLFWALAALILVPGVGLLIAPLVRGSAAPERDTRRDVTLAAHRDRLAELERDDRAGEEDDSATRHEAQLEAERALLREAGANTSPSPVPGDITPGESARHTRRPVAAAVLGVSFPLFAIALWFWLGEPRALSSDETATPAATLSNQPRDIADRLIAAAQELASTQGSLDGEPLKLIEEAIVEAPNHPRALWFGVIAALHANRPKVAIERLERLRLLGPLDAQEAELFEQLMADARARLDGS